MTALSAEPRLAGEMPASEPPDPSADSGLARGRAQASKAASEEALPAGLRIAGRFVIERCVGGGGMGSVYRARDEQSGGVVALKVLAADITDARRFGRETAVLARLDHPAIVSHVAHGRFDEEGRLADQGRPFLAMQWLDGPSLRERLVTGPLSVEETLAVGRRLCEGLAFMHSRGLIHRDVKPSNLILVSGQASELELVDFGIARPWRPETALTQAGMRVGTVGYMAPEQAQGFEKVDARADLFALGCVLYECLTGRPPFFASHAVAVLAKVLLFETEPISSHRPEVPGALVALVERLLAKAARERPASAEEVLLEIDRVGASLESAARVSASRRLEASSGARVMTVLIVSAPRGHEIAEKSSMGAIVAAARGEAALLADGTAVVSFDVGAGAAEQAGRAARCALALRDELPKSALVLTTGRGKRTARAPIGPALDRGSELLERAATTNEILLDEVTASLLEARFELRQSDGASSLRREIGPDELPTFRRRVLGREVPYVGRRKELLLLETMLDEVEDDEVVRALLVTGPAGIGKSRLAIEFEAMLARRGARRLLARATPMAQEASGAMLEILIRSAAALSRGEERKNAWPLIERYVHGLGVDEPALAAEILGEFVGAPSPNAPSAALAAAREDPSVLSYWLGRVVPEWLRAECARRSLTIVLEDVHWADAASLALLDGALAQLGDASLFVLALARPEVHAQFSPLFRNTPVQEMALVGLSRRAAEEMIRAALPDVAAPRLEAMIARAGGNPFFLEELARASAAGQEELPESILAITEEHLDRVDPETRRVLRAASVFVEHCTSEGVAYLLGDVTGEHTTSLLDVLVADEILQQRFPERVQDDPEYAFWHVLLRDAAYAMLPAEERPEVHARAARWLEARGAEPSVLAEHWERAGELANAARCCLEAAQAAYSRGDLEGAVRHCERGLAFEPERELEGQLLFTMGFAQGFAGYFEHCTAPLRRAIPLLEEGTRGSVLALAALLYSCSTTMDHEGVQEATASLGDAFLKLEPSGPSSLALMLIIATRLFEHGVEPNCPYRAALERMDRLAGEHDPVVRAWAKFTAARVLEQQDEIAEALRLARSAVESFARVGEPIGLSVSTGLVALMSSQLGLAEDARCIVEKTRQVGDAGGLGYAAQFAALADAASDPKTNPRRASEALERIARTGPLDLRSYAAVLLASLALHRGDDEIVEWACDRIERGSIYAARKAPHVFRGLLAMRRGDLSAARDELARSEGPPEGETIMHGIATARDMLRLALHRAAGEEELARSAAERAWARLVRTAGGLAEGDRESFWTRGADVAWTMELIEDVLGPRDPKERG